MTDPRIHHFTTQAYLKGFTRDGRKDSQLFAINLSDGKSFYTIPKNVGAERDFNRVEGLPPGALESALSGFETQVGAALGRIHERRSIDNSDDWIAVLNLLALFAVRNPRMREMMRGCVDEIARMMLDITLATPDRWAAQVRRMKAAGAIDDEPKMTYEELKRFHEDGQYDITVSNSMHVKREIKLHNVILRTMADRRWLLCVADRDSGGFAASDHPVCLIHSDGSMPTFQRPIGHGLANSTVIFPVSYELLAVGTFEGSRGVRNLTPLQVAYMNGLAYAFAERQVFARDETFRLVTNDNPEPISGAELSRRLTAVENL